MDKNGVRFLLTGHLDVGFFVISEIIYIYTYTHTPYVLTFKNSIFPPLPTHTPYTEVFILKYSKKQP